MYRLSRVRLGALIARLPPVVRQKLTLSNSALGHSPPNCPLLESVEQLIIAADNSIILSVKFLSHSPQQTVGFAQALAGSLKGGEVIALSGEMGSGKTTFTKGIAQGLGITDTAQSPTFSFLRIYEGRLRLCHFDAYRLERETEASEMGFDEFLGDCENVCVIEWPSKLGLSLNGYDVIKINIETRKGDESVREISVSPDRFVHL